MTAGAQQATGMDDGLPEINPITAAARHKLVVAGVLAAGILLALAFASTRSTTYTSEAGLLLDDPRNTALGDVRPLRDQLRYAADQVAIIRSTVVSARAASAANRQDPGLALTVRGLQKKVTVISSDSSNYVKVSATASSPGDARVIANAVVAAYRGVVAETLATETRATVARIDKAIAATAAKLSRLTAAGASASAREDAQSKLDALRDRRNDLLSANEVLGDGVSLVAAAERGRADAVGLKTILVVVLALFSVIALAIAYILETRRPRIRSASVAEGLIGAPVLLDVPVLALGSGEVSEAFDFLVLGAGLGASRPAAEEEPLLPADVAKLTRQELTVLSLLGRGLGNQAVASRVPGLSRAKVDATVKALCAKLGEPDSAALAQRARSLADLIPPPGAPRSLPGIVAVCAAEAGAGVSTLVASTAIAAARAGRRVLVLDCGADEHGPAAVAGGNGRPPLSLVDLLHGRPGTSAITLVDGPSPGVVKVVRLARPGQDAAELFRAGGLSTAMSAIGEGFDLVLGDVPAVLEHGVAAPVLLAAESVIAVVPHGSDVRLARRLRDRLSLLAVQPLGILYNRRPSSRLGAVRLPLSSVRPGRPSAPAAKQANATAPEPPAPPAKPAPEVRATRSRAARRHRPRVTSVDTIDEARPKEDA